jgi:hypothetical protein
LSRPEEESLKLRKYKLSIHIIRDEYKFTGAKIAPDEFIQHELVMDYNENRDRRSGYDLSEHKSVTEEYQAYQASYPLGTRGSFPGNIAAGTLS